MMLQGICILLVVLPLVVGQLTGNDCRDQQCGSEERIYQLEQLVANLHTRLTNIGKLTAKDLSNILVYYERDPYG